MKITLHGAAGEVTGSAYLVETDRTRILVDFGMFQGSSMAGAHNVVPPGLDPGRIEAVVLTHAHLDHVGRLPLLAANGFRGGVYCTAATEDLATLILNDAAKIQLHDNERTNRKRERAGDEPVQPLFSFQDVADILGRFRALDYDADQDVAPGIRARFLEAGHLLGSASILLQVEEGGRTKRVVFSGDLGPRGAPLLRDFESPDGADLVFLESTYGDRDHRPYGETVTQFREIVRSVVAAQGKILVPTFAVGRAQVLLYELARMFREESLPPFPIILDSPMAIEAVQIYGRHPELFDEEAVTFRRTQRAGRPDIPGFQISITGDDSRRLNVLRGPSMILAGAGMCNAGRILHHLKNSLFRKETHVLIVGFQAEGSLGRRLVDGATQVSIYGEKIAVRAQVHTLGGFSAHAGQTDLLAWFEPLAKGKPRVALTHGESKGREPLAAKIREKWGIEPALPDMGAVFEV